MKKARWFWLLVVIGLAVFPVAAQAPQLPPLAAIEGGRLVIHTAGGDTTVPTEGYDNLGALAWSPDGQRLLFEGRDQNQTWTLLLTNVFGDVPRTVASPIAYGYPGSFIDANDVLYARIDASQQDASGKGQVDIYRTGLTEGAEPVLVGGYAADISCAGGSPFPADYQYAAETGFAANPKILAQTPAGIVHTASCSGFETSLLDPATGADKRIGDLARVSVSPDGTTLAGVEITPKVGPPQRTLVTVDLTTLTETPVKTAATPDQVTWSADGSALFYSSSEVTGKVALTAAEEKAFEAATLTDTDVALKTATLHRVDLQSGQETTLTQLDAYVIARLSAAPDGKSVYISTVANMSDWAKGVANHTVEPIETATETVPVTLYQVDLSGGQPVKLSDALQAFTLNKASMPAS